MQQFDFKSRVLAGSFVVILFIPLTLPWILSITDMDSHIPKPALKRLANTLAERKILKLIPFVLEYDRMRAWLRYYEFGLSPNENILRAKDNWLFRIKGDFGADGVVKKLPNFMEDHIGRNQFSEQELKRWARVLTKRNNYLRKKGARYIFAIAPKKSEIYPDVFPEKVRSRFRRSRAVQLIKYLQENTQVPVVDLINTLKRYRRIHPDSPNLFLKTDGHWNTFGAFLAYQAIINKANSMFPRKRVAPLRASQFQVRSDKRWYHRGFSLFSGLKIREPFPYFIPKKGNPLLNVPVYRKAKKLWQPKRNQEPFNNVAINQLLQRGVGRLGQPGKYLENKAGVGMKYSLIKNFADTKLSTILVMGDSFCKKMLYFFAAHAEKTFRYRETLGFDPHLFSVSKKRRGKIELVIQEMAQGALNRDLPTSNFSIRK